MEIKDTVVEEEYRTAWIEAEYIVAGWWEDDRTRIKREDNEQV